jgi:hypothetical protein
MAKLNTSRIVSSLDGSASMKLSSLALLLHLFASSVMAQASKTTPTPKQDPCRISGAVVKLAGSEPLRKARLNLLSMDDRTHAVAVVTDGDGHFEFKGVDPGKYKLTASRVGYVTSEYGQRKPNDPGAVLTLRPGQVVKDLLFRLVPAGIISGRIMDEDGEALPGVEVSALREVYSEGKRSLSTLTMVETNDLGQYRLYGLPPGRYFVSAVYPQWSRFGGTENAGDSEPSTQGYAKMYYPGTPEAAQASALAVKQGEEIPSVEMLLRQVLVHRIRGHVYNQITHKPGVGVTLMLSAKATTQEWEAGNQQAHVEKQDGSFEISEVIPGSYALTAFWFDEAKVYSTTTVVEVGDADVDGLAVTIAPGVSVNGQIIWEGKPSVERDELSVTPRLVDSVLFSRGTVRVSQENSFTLKDVGDGTYRVDVSGESKDCYIKDVRYGPSAALDEGFTVARGAPANLEITISSRGARLQGTVSDADGLPAAGVWVVLVPGAPHRSNHRRYKSQTTDQYGHFDLHGIAPGDYALFSWNEVEEGAWEDAAFLKPFEEKAEKVTLQEGDAKSASLTPIKTTSTEQQKP